MNHSDPLKQWQYYESLLDRYVSSHNFESELTFAVLPEYALGNRSNYSESSIEKLIDKISSFATTRNIHTVAGSLARYENSKWFNRAMIFEANSNHIHEYDKTHLFNFELKNDITPGTKPGLFTIAGLKVKMLICSDLWFPEEIRKLMQEKIDLIIVPAMAVVKNKQFVNYGKSLWYSLAQTRSKENVIPLVVSDWAEQPVRDSYTCGASCIVDPSIRWTNASEESLSFATLPTGVEGIIASTISHKKILDYQKYRREVGLLPDFSI